MSPRPHLQSHPQAPGAHAGPTDVPRLLSEATCHSILDQLHEFGLARNARVDLISQWRGAVRWARNRMTTEVDWRTNTLHIGDTVTLNQIDPASLRGAAARAGGPTPLEPYVSWLQHRPYPATHIWSEATYLQSPEERTRLVTQLTTTVEQAGMLAAGYLSVEARGTLYWLKEGSFLYAPRTLAQCSITVRDPQGTGSGWAGASSYDWSRIDVAKLAAVALEKGLTSRNPVKLEPGRYTVILEPQATFELVRQLFPNGDDDSAPKTVGMGAFLDESIDYMSRERNEFISRQPFPFTEAPTVLKYRTPRGPMEYGKTRLGLQLFDPRLTVRSDPLDPELGTLPFSDKDGDPYVPVTWVEQGVLKVLATDSSYSVPALRAQPQPWSGAFRLEGNTPPVSMDEMIATTTRGLLVTRFSGVQVMNQASVLCTGTTRDGLWLIEHGKITKPVQNFRFTESPVFALNNVEQIGQPVPIFQPTCPAVVPALKVRDFSFTSLIDAV